MTDLRWIVPHRTRCTYNSKRRIRPAPCTPGTVGGTSASCSPFFMTGVQKFQTTFRGGHKFQTTSRLKRGHSTIIRGIDNVSMPRLLRVGTFPEGSGSSLRARNTFARSQQRPDVTVVRTHPQSQPLRTIANTSSASYQSSTSSLYSTAAHWSQQHIDAVAGVGAKRHLNVSSVCPLAPRQQFVHRILGLPDRFHIAIIELAHLVFIHHLLYSKEHINSMRPVFPSLPSERYDGCARICPNSAKPQIRHASWSMRLQATPRSVGPAVFKG